MKRRAKRDPLKGRDRVRAERYAELSPLERLKILEAYHRFASRRARSKRHPS